MVLTHFSLPTLACRVGFRDRTRGFDSLSPVWQSFSALSINQSIKTHLYSAICRERIRQVYQRFLKVCARVCGSLVYLLYSLQQVGV